MERTNVTKRSIKLRIALLSHGLGSYEKLAQITQIDRSRLSRIANEWVQPSADEAKRISEAVGAAVEELFGER